jgi:hypothetical protein
VSGSESPTTTGTGLPATTESELTAATDEKTNTCVSGETIVTDDLRING